MRTLVLVALAACSPRSNANTDRDQPEPPRPVQLERPSVVQFDMRTHLLDLKTTGRHLIAGKLDDAQATAFLLTTPAEDRGLDPWQADTDLMIAEAKGLTEARSVDEGFRRVARIAQTCAECHIKSQTPPMFPQPTAPPGDDGSQTARIARHEWAVDRLWEGLVAGADGPWVNGLEVLRVTPPPETPVTDAPAVGARLQQLSANALARQQRQTETLDSRTLAFGEMLGTCAACHESLEERAIEARRQ